MSEPMSEQRLKELEPLFRKWGFAYKEIREGGAECLEEIRRLREGWDEIGRSAERRLESAVKVVAYINRLKKTTEGREAAMQEALSLVEYMANNWPGCACDSEDKCNIHLVEGILRTSLEKP